LYNPYLVVPLLVWAITQFLKFIIAAINGRIDFRYLYASGGMPSVHSAVVTSLATTAFLVDGPRSALFGITVILAAIVMYDSFGVRRSSGEQAAAINVILESMNKDRIPLSHPQQRLRELLGHKPMEVTIGALLGLVLAGLFNLNRLNAFFNMVTTPVGRKVTLALAVVAGAVFVASLIARFVLRRRFPVATVQQAVNHLSSAGLLLGFIGGLLAFLQYERIVVALWRLWPVVWLVALAAAAWSLYWPYRTRIPEALAAYSEQTEKSKWFEGPNKKKRAAKARAKKRR
jgi:acid phosphatase family membrane protein YuiD